MKWPLQAFGCSSLWNKFRGIPRHGKGCWEEETARTPGGEKMGRCQVSKHKCNHCKLPWKHKLHLLVREGRWSHPPTQSCSDPHRHRISQSKSPILLPDGQGENHFCISWQGEHHNWDHLLWRKQGFGLCLLRWERRKHGTLCGCCSPWLQHISRSCPVPSSGGKSARWLVSCWSMMLSLQVLRTL